MVRGQGKLVRLFIYEFISAGGLGPDAPESLRREGRAMLQAAVEDFRRVPGVEVTTLADDCPCEPDAFRVHAADADASLVIAPEFDDLLLHRSRWVLELGGRLLGSHPNAIQLAGDKLATWQHWHEHGVSTPATIRAQPLPPLNFGPPWVCKPRYGAGSLATMRIDREAEWGPASDAARASWEMIAQPYVPGLAASVAFLVAGEHRVPLAPTLQVLSDDGRFQYRGGRIPLPPPLCDRAVRLAKSALADIDGLQGWVGVDLVLGPDGADDAIEINPRLTTSYIGLRRLCRENLAQAWCNLLRGEDVRLTWEDRVVEFDADGVVCG